MDYQTEIARLEKAYNDKLAEAEVLFQKLQKAKFLETHEKELLAAARTKLEAEVA